MIDLLYIFYPWIKALHVMAVISWMAGLFYLPRLFVYHVERAENVDGASEIFQTMEEKLLRIIMGPAMAVTWVCGLIMAFTPGIVDWSAVWPWTKAAGVLAMTGFHHWLVKCHRDLAAGRSSQTG
ncbi:MAG: CopD family protein, partial [Pseudomonadota bacterium]